LAPPHLRLGVSAVNSATRGLLFATLLFIVGTRSTLAGPGPSPGLSVEAPTISSMRFDLREGFLIVVDGQIGSLEHLKFILDTGASRTMVSNKVASRLPMPRQTSTIFNFDRPIATQTLEIPPLRFGPILASGIRAMVGNLGQHSEFARDVDAIIGLDVLGRTAALRIDYDSKIVGFVQNSPAQRLQPLVHGAIAVQVLVQGEPVHLLVDTGLQGIVMYERPLHERHIKISEGVPASMGHLTGQRVALSGIRLGANESNASVFLINNQTDVALVGVDGYLGPTALNAKWIELDFKFMTMRWR